MTEKYSQKTVSALFISVFFVGLTVIVLDFLQKIENENVENRSVMNLAQSGTPRHFVTEDFRSLYESKELPTFFLNLKKITWFYRETDLQNLIPENSLPFTPISSGLYNLEVEAFSASNETSRVIVLQFNLFEIKSGNKVFELSRNYEIKK